MARTTFSAPVTHVDLEADEDREHRLRVHLLQAEKIFWEREAERLAQRLADIPAAVERWGHVTVDGHKLVEVDPDKLDKLRNGETVELHGLLLMTETAAMRKSGDIP